MKTKEEIRLEEPISVMCLHGRYLRIDETYCQELLQKSTSQMNCAPLHIQSPSLHHYSARPGHKFEWSWDIPWVFLIAKGDGHSVLAAQSYTQHTSFLLLNGTATLRCHITQGWKEPLQLCIHWKCPAKPLNVWSLWMTTHRQGNNVIGMNFSPYSPNLDGVWGSKSLGTLSCGKTMKRKWGKIPAESEFCLQICS